MVREDDFLTWKMKVAAILRVYQHGGRIVLIDTDDVKWVVERRPEVVAKIIRERIKAVGGFMLV